MKSTQKKSRPLHLIGWWATFWWGVSGVYLLVVVWWAKDFVVSQADWSWAAWQAAIRQAFTTHPVLTGLAFTIGAIWLVIAIAWFRALAKSGYSTADGLKALFFTPRGLPDRPKRQK